MFAAGLMAQTTPMSSSEARKINMSRINGKAALKNNNQVMTDSNVTIKGTSYIGVNTTVVDGALVISGFADNSTARAAKLKVKDIITSVNSKSVTTVQELNAAIEAYEPGDVVTIGYTRGERKLTKDVRLNKK